MVTAFCALTTTGAAETLAQAEDVRFVADCKRKPIAFVGQVKTTFEPEELMPKDGEVGSVRVNTVPSPANPPEFAVPYSRLLTIIGWSFGDSPSLLVS